MIYEIKFTSQFKRDYKKSKRKGKDISKLDFFINSLARGQRLAYKYREHCVIGNYIGCI